MPPERPTIIHNLLIPELLNLARKSFTEVKDSVTRKVTYSLADCLMSGLAIFGLKYPSLLQFDDDCRGDPILQHNLKTLFGVNQAPSDTYFRERLDPIEPHHLQPAIDGIIDTLKKNKTLERYKYTDDHYLISLDATGNFSSHKVHCKHCCEKHHKDGSITYHHQTLAAVMVHPKFNTVLPMMIEPITKADGDVKNDCEHNAAKRLLVNLRQQHPDLKMIIVMDGLYADGPIISLLKELNFSFIITARDKDLKHLFSQYDKVDKREIITTSSSEALLTHHYASDLQLNKTQADILVNILECNELAAKNKKTRYCWISDLVLNRASVPIIAAGGRARWQIENETFNTLKNQGYHFEHNFGHGYEHLSEVLTYLMFIAFLIDQVLQLCCEAFMQLLTKCKRKIRVWRKMSAYFTAHYIDSWEELYLMILGGVGGRASQILNSG